MRNTDRTDFRTVKQVSLIGVLFLLFMQQNHPKEFDLTTEFLTRLILICT